MTTSKKTLVISDIHGNADALRAVMEAESDADQSIFLGDALLSGPQANETAELLQELDPDIAIMGNHDDEVLDPSIFSKWPAEWVDLNNWIIDNLEASAVKLIEQYQPAGEYQLGDMKMFLHHGKVAHDSHAAIPDAPDESFLSLDNDSDVPMVLFGHTHVQFTRQIGDKLYINPGSVGQPRCGKLHACYGVFEDGEYSPRQVTYDPAAWLDKLDNIDALDAHPDFRQWLRNGLLSGYGIGENEPWTRFAAQGYC